MELAIEGEALSGAGTCVVNEGPGAGMSIMIDLTGTLDGGAVLGQITLALEGMPDQPEPVGLEGTVDSSAMDLSFVFEASPPDQPDQVDIMDGRILAHPVE